MTQKTTCPICSRYATQPPAVLALAHEVAVESYGHAGTYAGQGMLGIEDVPTRERFSALARENFDTMQTIRACPGARPPADPPATLEEEIAAARRDPAMSAAMDRHRAEMAADPPASGEGEAWPDAEWCDDAVFAVADLLRHAGTDAAIQRLRSAIASLPPSPAVRAAHDEDTRAYRKERERHLAEKFGAPRPAPDTSALAACVAELEAALAAATDPEAVDLEALDKAALLLSDQSNGIFATLPDAYRKAAERLRVLRAALAAPHPAPTLTDLMADIDEAEKRGDTNFIFHAAARQLLPGQRLLLTALDGEGGFKLEEAPQAVGAGSVARAPEAPPSDEKIPAWHPLMSNVMKEVKRERERQEVKWGQQDHHPFHALAILMEEVGEASQAAVQAVGEPGKKGWTEYRKELIQVAAVAVQMVEAFDRNGAPLAALTGGGKQYPSDEEIIRDTDAAMVRPGFGKGNGVKR